MASKCKCRVCGRNDVEYAGAICDLCALGKDPYSGGSGYGNSGYGNSGYGGSSSNLPEERGYGGLTNPGNGGGGVNVYKPGEFVTTSGGNNVGGNVKAGGSIEWD